MKVRKLLWSSLVALGAMSHAGADSLYQPATYQALTSDLRVRHVGDLITVMVYENASASSSANTSAGRDAALGFEIQAPGKGFTGAVHSANQTDGRGRTQRDGKLLAQITVSIRQITERGDLIIGGEQSLEINNERQQIAVEGRIRPQDVSDTNVVLSTRIANAKISYAGQGDLADKQRPAWWLRFLAHFGV